MLMNGSSKEVQLQSNVAAFVEVVRDVGWVEGRNVILERALERWCRGECANACRRIGRSFARRDPVRAPTTNLLALQDATRTIPIVFLQVSDPVAQGFVTTVTKPGGNITGFSAYEFSVGGKWLELLKQMSPGLAHIAR